MKHLKLFELFRNTTEADEIRKEFPKWTLPNGRKRKLTEEENEKMYRHFQGHSWHNFIDNNGFIILGGGDDEPGGKYYITEDDLKNLY